MTIAMDPVLHWTRQLTVFRSQLARLSKSGAIGRAVDLLETALSSCDCLIRDLAGAKLECDRLRAEVRAAHDAWDHLFEIIPAACLLADAGGWIVDANRHAGSLLNVSAKHLKGRELRIFAEDRTAFATLLRQLDKCGDWESRATLTIRPRERKPTKMDLVIRRLSGEYDGRWIWFLTTSADPFLVLKPRFAQTSAGREVDADTSVPATNVAPARAADSDRGAQVRQHATTHDQAP